MKEITAHRRGLLLLLGLAAVVAALGVTGCGGGGSTTTGTAQLATSGWKQVNATYVGRARCRDCHSAIDNDYSTQDMGDNAPTEMSGVSCGTCHVTGYGQPGGGLTDGSTPHLDGIGCENCHGPGSKHASSHNKADITRTPPAKDTCWTCHGDRPFNSLAGPIDTVTSAALRETKPGSVRGPHYPPAGFLLGVRGYNIAQAVPSPHTALKNTCVDCHTPGISGITGKVDHGVNAQKPNIDTTRPACASCHGGRSESETLLQAGVIEELIKIGGESPTTPGRPDSAANGGLLKAYATAHNISLTTNTAPDDPFVIAYKAARYNYNYLRKEGSWGVHNPPFARRLIDDTIALLK